MIKRLGAALRRVRSPNGVQVSGFTLIAIGVALIFLPAGLIIGGVLLCAVGLGMER